MFKGESDYQMSESFLVYVILATTGGFLDVYTYITRSQVFANAQTGNIVLLGLELAEGHIENALCYLAPILAFAAGILFTLETNRCSAGGPPPAPSCCNSVRSLGHSRKHPDFLCLRRPG